MKHVTDLRWYFESEDLLRGRGLLDGNEVEINVFRRLITIDDVNAEPQKTDRENVYNAPMPDYMRLLIGRQISVDGVAILAGFSTGIGYYRKDLGIPGDAYYVERLYGRLDEGGADSLFAALTRPTEGQLKRWDGMADYQIEADPEWIALRNIRTNEGVPLWSDPNDPTVSHADWAIDPLVPVPDPMKAATTREAAIELAVRNFSGKRLQDGRPQMTALQRMLGFKITANERDTALEAAGLLPE